VAKGINGGGGFKVAKWGMLFYPKTLQSRPARLR
jgi:hypothetical protein